MQSYSDNLIARSTTGAITGPLSGATVTVTVAGTGAAASIYSDDGVTVLPSNVLTTDSDGFFEFYAADGHYIVTIAKTRYPTITRHVLLNDDIGFAAQLLDTSGSAIVGFIQSGIGAVATTVQAELRERVSVTQFGADSTGVTDSSAAFTSAGSAAGAVPIEVNVPAGTWKLSSSPTPTGTVTWVINSGASFAGVGVLPGKIIHRGLNVQANVEIDYNKYAITNDFADVPSLTGTGTKAVGFLVNHAFGDSSTKGGRQGIYSRLQQQAVTSASSTDRNYSALVGNSTTAVGDGGGSGTEKGAYFGVAGVGTLFSGATHTLNVTGGEFDVDAFTGSSTLYRTGIQIVSGGDVQGSSTDAGISIYTLGSATTSFHTGIQFGGPDSGGTTNAIDSGGTILSVVQNGGISDLIDCTATVSGYLLNYSPASGVQVRLTPTGFFGNNSDFTQELGSLTASNSPHIDFHSSGNNIDYDSRIIASGGTGVSGNGVLNYYAGKHTFNGAVQIGTATQTAKVDIVNSGDTHASPYTTYNTLGIKESITNTGTQGGYGNRLLWTQAGIATSGFSIAQAINGAFTNLNGAQGQNLWMVAQTPLTATGYTFGVVGSEINPVNLYGLPSTFRSRGENSRWAGGIQVATESHDLLTGGANITTYPSLFAFAVTHSNGLASTGKHQKTANGLLIERDSIYPAGSGLRLSGLLQVSTITGSISGNTLTVTAKTTNRDQIYVGQVVTGAGIASATITADVNGNGDTGDYTIDGGAQTIASETITLTAPLSDAPNEAMRIEDYWINGIYTVDATFSNNRAIMLGNAHLLAGRNAANSADIDVIGVNASDQILISGSGNDIKLGTALVSLGGGAAPTVGTIGGSGPATAGQNSWMKFIDSTGAACFIPVWK